jgi:hypothetical protein
MNRAQVTLAYYLCPFGLVRRCAAHLSDGSQVDNDRTEMLADLWDSAAVVRRPCFTSASAEREPVLTLDPDVVSMAFRLVGDFVQARFVASDAHMLFAKLRGGVGELFGSLNLNHIKLSFAE